MEIFHKMGIMNYRPLWIILVFLIGVLAMRASKESAQISGQKLETVIARDARIDGDNYRQYSQGLAETLAHYSPEQLQKILHKVPLQVIEGRDDA